MVKNSINPVMVLVGNNKTEDNFVDTTNVVESFRSKKTIDIVSKTEKSIN
jgi:hypothetical protein